MSEERLRFIRSLDSLAPLSDHTDAIRVDEMGKVAIGYRLPPPCDEFGIPRPEIMVEALLSAMKTENYIWTGRFDEHHLATPKADFSIVRSEQEGRIGSAFRGLSCLKIDLPRQMHNFAHALFELPGRPTVETMRSAVREVGLAKQLQLSVNEYFPGAYSRESERTRRLGTEVIMKILHEADEPALGMLPPLEDLAEMEVDDLRKTVNSLLRVRRFSDKKLTHPAIRVNSRYRHHIVRKSSAAA